MAAPLGGDLRERIRAGRVSFTPRLPDRRRGVDRRMSPIENLEEKQSYRDQSQNDDYKFEDKIIPHSFDRRFRPESVNRQKRAGCAEAPKYTLQ